MSIKIHVRPLDEPSLRTPREFPDQLASLSLCPAAKDAGRKAKAVRVRIARSTAGWNVRPTAEEFYEAIREPRPSDRQAAIVAMWAQEAGPREMLLAWTQRAYSWRILVDALHRHGFTRRGELNDYLNCFAWYHIRCGKSLH